VTPMGGRFRPAISATLSRGGRPPRIREVRMNTPYLAERPRYAFDTFMARGIIALIERDSVIVQAE